MVRFTKVDVLVLFGATRWVLGYDLDLGLVLGLGCGYGLGALGIGLCFVVGVAVAVEAIVVVVVFPVLVLVPNVSWLRPLSQPPFPRSFIGSVRTTIPSFGIESHGLLLAGTIV